MRIFIYCFSCLVFSISLSAQSEQYSFSKLDIYNGLSHNQVNGILKDADGFLWFGTTSGLNRYDGYSYKIFRNKHNDSTSLYDNYVRSLNELPHGRMWVATGDTPSCVYNSYTEQFENYRNYLQSLGLPPGTVLSIVKGNGGRYWFVYDSLDLHVYSEADRRSKPFRRNFKFSASEKITSVRETKDGKLWLVYQNGFLQEYDIHSGKIIFSSTALQKLTQGNNPYNIFIDSDGDLWLWATNNGTYLFHSKNNSIRLFNERSFPSRLNSNLVTQIVQDNKGLIWVATDHGGVNLINKKDNFRVTYVMNDPKNPKSLAQNSILALYKDDHGIIWLGTYKQGVNYLNENIIKFPYYQSNAGNLQYNDVNRFVEDRLGNLWIGTNGGGLIYFDRKNNSFKQYVHDPNNNNSLSSNVIVSLCIDHEDKLWVGTYFGGLNCFDGKNFTHYRHNSNDTSTLADDNVWEIFEDSEHNLWVGTLGNGLDLFDKKTKRFKHYQYKDDQTGPLPSNLITAMIQDRKGNLWIGTDRGVTVFEKNKATPTHYKHTSADHSLSDNSVICLLEDSKGRIWVGTHEGLNLWNEGTNTFQTFTATDDALPDNAILNILEDNRQTLWLSTPNGFCNVIPEIKESGLALSVINYDEMNNLQNREFNENAALKTKAGELVFGGPAGFNIIQPEKISRPIYQPRVVLTGLQILNNTIEVGEQVNDRVLLNQSLLRLEKIDLKYRENMFSIEFASLDFPHGNRDRYAYMLEGFNTDWLYADGSQRRATYTNLDPGSYTFKVKAMRSDGVWSEEKSLRIHIAPPFWRTPLAYIIYALVLTGLIYLARRITLDRIHMRFEMKQQRREVERAHALEQLKTKFFTNVSHEFRTPLSLIISPLDKIIKNTGDEDQKKQLNLVQRNAKRLLNLVNQLLDFRKMEVQEIKLHPAIGDIIHFIKDISFSFTDIAEKKSIRFSFHSNIESLEIYFDRDKIEKILFNLLSNAFKYTHDNGEVSVRLEYTPDNGESIGTLGIEVSDTGIGIPADKHEMIFERFFQTDVPDSMVNQGTGIGLAITKEFVKLHEGVITVKSEPEKGTSFKVLLPAKKINEIVSRPAQNVLPVEETEQMIFEEIQSNGRKKTILIVEDNEDLRFYLKDNLKAQYHVDEAANGKEGWEKVRLLNPDLVVSDIMMPLMDGIELARNIKTETTTAHIPVILLTAMGSEEKQLEGFKVGVSDYITKPFTFEILASRIKNLLAQQKLLQKRFQKQIEINPSEITVTPVDEKFMKQALAAVEKNMDNPDFSVEDLSREMYMSRVALYRKILSLTGKTPLEFIRSIRLKRAVQLLDKSGMSVSEIAYEVGFNNPKNFTKYFKEEFKVLPSQYLSSKKEKTS